MRSNRQDPLPEVTNIIARMEGSSTTFQLTKNDIDKLRHSAGGQLNMVIYKEGLACIPSSYRERLVNTNAVHDAEVQFQMLMSVKSDLLNCTTNILRTNATTF